MELSSDIKFLKAKNNEDTAIVNQILLHSSYNPSREAERYVQNLQLPFKTDCIIITEPALSYVIPFIKSRFNCQVGIIRFFNDFSKFNNADFVINYYENKTNFSDYLFNKLGDEKLLTSYFLSYETTAKAFPETNNIVWQEIKKSIEKAKTLLVTRQYFEKKWLLNSINYFSNVRKTVKINTETEKQIVICASGPSLKNSLPIIKKNRNQIFLICLSSAISVLKFYEITPDLYFSTDGGFWAGEHLKHIDKNIPLALTTEAYCKKSTLVNQTILPLFYSDGLSKQIYDCCNASFYQAERNGTVSGTALKFAEKLTDKEIFFCGLDLSSQNGFQHTQPNEIEKNNNLKDCKINSLENRVYPGSFTSESLKIYENWFIYQRTENKIFRVIENKKNDLNEIKDISFEDFENSISSDKSKEENIFSTNCELDIKENTRKIYDFVLKNCDSDNWKKALFPLDFVSLKHDPENKDLQNKIDNENKKLLNKIWKILNV